MQDVLLACGELNKRERVAVQWVLDKVNASKQDEGHVHTIYEAVGGDYICSGCEQRFSTVNASPGLTVDEVMRELTEVTRPPEVRVAVIRAAFRSRLEAAIKAKNR